MRKILNFVLFLCIVLKADTPDVRYLCPISCGDDSYLMGGFYVDAYYIDDDSEGCFGNKYYRYYQGVRYVYETGCSTKNPCNINETWNRTSQTCECNDGYYESSDGCVPDPCTNPNQH